MICDAGLHARLTELRAIGQVLSRQTNWPYAERGRKALDLVDGRRESPLESWSFVRLHGRGIAMPIPQAEVFDEDGRFVARVDGWWPEHGTVCEVDGRQKYALGANNNPSTIAGPLVQESAEATRRAIVAEKVREDRLRALGLQVVRWGYLDVVRRLSGVVADIEAAWHRGRPGLVSGAVMAPRG